MDKFVIDTTTRLRDYVEIPLPRNDPRIGQMKYFTSGFIFLQDKIEQSIASLQAMTENLPSMFMQQFPNPCFEFDTFLFAIGPSYPLYMNLAFVFSCAMIIKSIVYEKERRLKETMRTMGLGNGVHWMAWFIDSIMILLFACVLLPIIIYVSIHFMVEIYLVLRQLNYFFLLTVRKYFGKIESVRCVRLAYKF
jgi:ATP-binding cassette subfamily A (ABC1) protein 1